MIVELRQYTLHPGARDTLIDIFERNFVTGQEAEGITLLGRYRDLDDPDRFVWVRGFPDSATRAASLAAFYGGPVWKAHREAANATMVDSDNVLQLRPVHTGTIARDGAVVATICYLHKPADDAFLARFERQIVPQILAAGGELLASFVSDGRPNDFPALPIRDVLAFIWFAHYPTSEGPGLDLASLRDAMLADPEIHRLKHTP
jgi:quinol monooxygenase YgiN